MNVCRLFYLLRRKEQFFRVVFLLLLFLNVFFLLEYFISPLHARRLVVCEQHKRGGAEMTCSQRKDENEHKKWAGTTKKKVFYSRDQGLCSTKKRGEIRTTKNCDSGVVSGLRVWQIIF